MCFTNPIYSILKWKRADRSRATTALQLILPIGLRLPFGHHFPTPWDVNGPQKICGQARQMTLQNRVGLLQK